MNKELIKLKDGAVVDIFSNFYQYEGSCPTCDYGAYSESEYYFEFKNNKKPFRLSTRNTHLDTPLFSLGDMMRILCNLDNEELCETTEENFGEFILAKIRQYARNNLKNSCYILNDVKEYIISDRFCNRVKPCSCYRLKDIILWAFEDNKGRISFYQIGYNRVTKSPVVITIKEIEVTMGDTIFLKPVSLKNPEILDLLKNTKLYNRDMLTFVKKLEHQSRKKETRNGDN